MSLPTWAPRPVAIAASFAAWLAGAVCSAQAPADAATASFPTAVAPDEPRWIEIRSTTSVTVRLVVDGKPISAVGGKVLDGKHREEETTIVVDTLLDPAKQPAGRAWSGMRRIVRAQGTSDGVVSDPDTNGIEMDIWREGNLIHCELRGERGVTPKSLPDLVHDAQAFALGPDVVLPATAKVGDSFDVPFEALAACCMGTMGTATNAVAHLRFESIDPKSNVARLRGKAEVEETFENTAEQLASSSGMKGVGRYEGDVTIDYDLAANRIARIVCRGTGRIEGDSVGGAPAKMAIEGAFESTVTSKVGKVAAAALAEKPKFRDVPRESLKSGVSIALPSHFGKLKAAVLEADEFQSVLTGLQSFVRVDVMPVPSHSLPLKEFGIAYREDFAKSPNISNVKEVTTSGGLGVGSGFGFTSGDNRGLVAIFPVTAKQHVVVIFITPATAFAEKSKEWPRFLQSMKKLPAGS